MKQAYSLITLIRENNTKPSQGYPITRMDKQRHLRKINIYGSYPPRLICLYIKNTKIGTIYYPF